MTKEKTKKRNFKKTAIIVVLAITIMMGVAGAITPVFASATKNVQATLQMPKNMIPGETAEVIVNIKVLNLSVAKFNIVSSDSSVIQVTEGGGPLMIEGKGTITAKAKIKSLKAGKATISVKNDVSGGESQSIDMETLDRLDFAAAVPVVVAPKESEVKPDVPVEKEKDPANPAPSAPKPEAPQKKEPVVKQEADKMFDNPLISEIEVRGGDGTIHHTLKVSKETKSYEVTVPVGVDYVMVLPTAQGVGVELTSDFAEKFTFEDGPITAVLTAEYKGVKESYSVTVSMESMAPVFKEYKGVKYEINKNNVINPTGTTEILPGVHKLPSGVELQVLEDQSGENYIFVVGKDGELLTKVQPIIKDGEVYFIVDIPEGQTIEESTSVLSEYEFDYSLFEELNTSLKMGYKYDKFNSNQEYYVLAFSAKSDVDSASIYMMNPQSGELYDTDVSIDAAPSIVDDNVCYILAIVLAFLVGALIPTLLYKRVIKKIKKSKEVDNRVIVGYDDEVEETLTPRLTQPIQDVDLDETADSLLEANKMPNETLIFKKEDLIPVEEVVVVEVDKEVEVVKEVKQSQEEEVQTPDIGNIMGEDEEDYEEVDDSESEKEVEEGDFSSTMILDKLIEGESKKEGRKPLFNFDTTDKGEW